MQILLQGKYNIGVLRVNIEFIWLSTKRMERLAKARLSPVSKPRHINSIFTVNIPILYIQQILEVTVIISPYIVNRIAYLTGWRIWVKTTDLPQVTANFIT